tara:strand:+ start:13440 stop:13775 length:336 start_codon:yes stop_codon:yes gene_type:complete
MDTLDSYTTQDAAALQSGHNLHYPGNPDAARRAAVTYATHMSKQAEFPVDTAKYIMSMHGQGGTVNGAESHFFSAAAMMHTVDDARSLVPGVVQKAPRAAGKKPARKTVVA